MFGHRARRLVTAGAAALALAASTVSPAAASFDRCSLYETAYGFTLRSCITVSQDASPWQYYGYASYNGTGSWADCSLQLRLFHGASANVQVRYHSASCGLQFAYPGQYFDVRGEPRFCPQPGYSYKVSLRVVGILNGQSVSHSAISSVVPESEGTGTCGNTGVNPALPELPAIVTPHV